MLRKIFSYGGALLLAWVVVLATPSLGRAQHGGGGHGGGGNFGGGHFGGGYSGAYHGGGNVGGYRGGIYHGGANFGGYRGGIYHDGFHRYGLYGYGYPYYDSYGSNYYPYDYGTNPYLGSSPTYDSGNDGSDTGLMPNDADGVTSAAASADNYQTLPPPAKGTYQSHASAHITVKVPAGARIWFDDTPTTSTGAIREFYSPLLAPGNRHTYEILARWNENGHDVTQSQEVEVTAGAHVNVEFPVPPKTSGQASAVEDK